MWPCSSCRSLKVYIVCQKKHSQLKHKSWSLAVSEENPVSDCVTRDQYVLRQKCKCTRDPQTSSPTLSRLADIYNPVPFLLGFITAMLYYYCSLFLKPLFLFGGLGMGVEAQQPCLNILIQPLFHTSDRIQPNHFPLK